jgi:hypothetical protein
MRRLILGCVSLFLIATVHAASFEEARAAAKNGDWNTAIHHYETILKEHGDSASVHYNLGLCYQQQADTGRAVLAYERCLAMNPRAADARHNLAILREKESLPMLDTLPEGLPPFVAWFSRGEWTMLFLTALVLLLAASWMAVFTSTSIRRVCMAVIFFSIILAIASAWVGIKRSGVTSMAVILSSGQSLRLSPFANADEVISCPAGSLCMIEWEQGNFFYVRMLSGNSRGWLTKQHLERIARRR